MRYVLTLTLLLLYFTATAKYENLLHRTYAQRYDDIDTTFLRYRLSKYDSNRYLNELSILEKLAIKEGDEELALEARWLHAAFYRNGVRGKGPFIIPICEAIIENAKKIGSKQMVMRSYMLMGLYYYEVKHFYAPAVYYYLHCYNVLQQLSVEEFPNKKEPLTLIGSAFYSIGDYSTAERILKEADAVPMILRPGSPKHFVFIKLYNTLGQLYRDKKAYDTAFFYFQKGYDSAIASNEKIWPTIMKIDIASCYIAKGEYDKGLQLIDRGVWHFARDSLFNESYNYNQTVAKGRIMEHDYVGALPYLQEMRLHVGLSGRDQHYERLYIWYGMMKAYYIGIGNYPYAYTYADSAIIANDSAHTRQKVIELAHISQNIQNEAFNNEMAKITAEKKIQLLWRNTSIIIITLLSIIFFMYVNGRRLKDKRKMMLAEEELRSASIQLETFARNIHEKNELIEKFCAEIEKYQALPCSNELPDKENNYKKLISSVILTEDQWVSFQSLFDKVHTGYIDRALTKFSDLTAGELRFLLLTKLGLNYKEIAGILGVSIDGARISKYRLLKRLKLPEGMNLQGLVDSI